jgi:hypothetical protein
MQSHLRTNVTRPLQRLWIEFKHNLYATITRAQFTTTVCAGYKNRGLKSSFYNKHAKVCKWRFYYTDRFSHLVQTADDTVSHYVCWTVCVLGEDFS